MDRSEIVVCDSDVMIEFLKGNQEIIETLENQIGVGNVVLSTITVMEIVKGSRNKSEQILIEKKLKPFSVIAVTATASEIAEGWIKDFWLSHKLEIPDAIIAATTVVYGLPIFTLNLKDFRYLPGIIFYNKG